jgi:hypothetical protein
MSSHMWFNFAYYLKDRFLYIRACIYLTCCVCVFVCEILDDESDHGSSNIGGNSILHTSKKRVGSIMAVFNFNINNVLHIHEVNHDLLMIAHRTGVYLLIVIEQQMHTSTYWYTEIIRELICKTQGHE